MANISSVDKTEGTAGQALPSLQSPGRVLRPVHVTEAVRGTLTIYTAIERAAAPALEVAEVP